MPPSERDHNVKAWSKSQNNSRSQNQTWLQGITWPSKVSLLQTTSPGSVSLALLTAQLWLLYHLVHHSALLWPRTALLLERAWPPWARHLTLPLCLPISLLRQDQAQDLVHSPPSPTGPWSWPPSQVLTAYLGPSNTQPRVQKGCLFCQQKISPVAPYAPGCPSYKTGIDHIYQDTLSGAKGKYGLCFPTVPTSQCHIDSHAHELTF